MGVSLLALRCHVATGRTKELSLELRQRFVSFAKSLSLSDDNIIFLKPIGNDQRGRREGDVGSAQPSTGKGDRETQSPVPVTREVVAPSLELVGPQGCWPQVVPLIV